MQMRQTSFDPEMKDKMRVTVIATGFDNVVPEPVVKKEEESKPEVETKREFAPFDSKIDFGKVRVGEGTLVTTGKVIDDSYEPEVKPTVKSISDDDGIDNIDDILTLFNKKN